MKSTPAFLGSALLSATLSVAHAGETPQSNPAPTENKMVASVPEAKIVHAPTPPPAPVVRNTERAHDRVNDILMGLPELTPAQTLSAADTNIVSRVREGVRANVTDRMQLVVGKDQSTGIRAGFKINLSDQASKNPGNGRLQLGVGIMDKKRVGFVLSYEN